MSLWIRSSKIHAPISTPMGFDTINIDIFTIFLNIGYGNHISNTQQ